jgi:hypothetical protein
MTKHMTEAKKIQAKRTHCHQKATRIVRELYREDFELIYNHLLTEAGLLLNESGFQKYKQLIANKKG